MDQNTVLSPEDAKKEWEAVASETLAKNSADENPQVTHANEGDGDQANEETPKLVVVEEGAEPSEPKAEPVIEDPMQVQFASIQKQLRQLNGHIGGLTSEQKRIKELMQDGANRATSKTDDAPSQNQINQAIANPEKWDALKLDFPDWAEATEEYVNSRLAVGKTASPSGDELQALISKEVEKVGLQSKKDALEAVHPDWLDTINSDEFKEWKVAQPEDVQALADSDNVRDAVKMLNKFEASKTAKPVTPPAKPVEKVDTETLEIQQKREAKLNNASNAPSKGGVEPITKTVDQLSPQELWNHEASQREKTRRERGY